VLASNTSSLSIDRLATAVPDPERVVGMHFFNPVDRMPLIAVVRGEATDDETLATVLDLVRRLGKTPVVVADGPGFLVNRLLGFYMAESLWLLDEGFSVAAIDQTMTAWGMPLGPLALIDEVGTDVALKVAHILKESFGDRLTLPAWATQIATDGRLGKKTARGIYEYSGGERQRPAPDIYDRIGLAAPSRPATTIPELIDRLVLRMVDEAARCLDEEIVDDAGDIDLAMIMGTGFPPFRGGLCRWADQRGLSDIVSEMRSLAETVGSRYGPSAALEGYAARGGFASPDE
jgi:3-hydroxyacyl-CoA dehydrogenase